MSAAITAPLSTSANVKGQAPRRASPRRRRFWLLRFRPSLGIACITAWTFAAVFGALLVVQTMQSSLFVMRCNEQWAARTYTDDICRQIDVWSQQFFGGMVAFGVVAIFCSVVWAGKWLLRRR